MPKILIEESALDRIKLMALELQEQRDELLEALKDTYPHIDNQALRFRIGSVIARCQESKKVFE